MNTGNETDIIKNLFMDIEPEQPSESFSLNLMNQIYIEASKKPRIAYKPIFSHFQIGVIFSSVIILCALIIFLGNNLSSTNESSYLSNFIKYITQFTKNNNFIFNPIYTLPAIVIFILLFLENKIRVIFKIK